MDNAEGGKAADYAALPLSAETVEQTLLDPDYVEWLVAQERIFTADSGFGKVRAFVRVAPPGYKHGVHRMTEVYPNEYIADLDGQPVGFTTVPLDDEQWQRFKTIYDGLRQELGVESMWEYWGPAKDWPISG